MTKIVVTQVVMVVSPIRTTEAARCAYRSHPCHWVSGVLAIRDGRVQAALPRRPVHSFKEEDYCYGVGTLTLRVERIVWDRPVRYEGDIWFEVDGIVIDDAGREGARREVLVRASRLPMRPLRKRPRRRG